MSKLFIIANCQVQGTARTLSDADRFCGANFANVATHVDECSLSGLEVFTDAELLEIVSNHKDGDYSNAARDSLIAIVFGVISDMQPLSNMFAVTEDKERVPYQIATLSDTQRIAQLGDHTQAGKGTTTLARSTTPTNAKRPKPGTASASIWDKCDELLTANGFESVKEAVMAWGKDELINPSTVRTQYGHWRRFSNLG